MEVEERPAPWDPSWVWQPGQRLGEGAYSTVHRCRPAAGSPGECPCAVKVMPLPIPSFLEVANREAAALRAVAALKPSAQHVVRLERFAVRDGCQGPPTCTGKARPEDELDLVEMFGMQRITMVAEAMVDDRLKAAAAAEGSASDARAPRPEEVQAALEELLRPPTCSCPDQTAYFVSELVPGRTLAVELADRAGHSLQQRLAWWPQIARQLLQGLTEMHEAGYAHLDVKPKNMQVWRDEGGAWRLKLLDLGFATPFKDGPGVAQEYSHSGGTPHYQPPEFLGFRPLDAGFKPLPKGPASYDLAAVDCWTAGCVLYEMLLGQPPFVVAEETIVKLLELRRDQRQWAIALADSKKEHRLGTSLEELPEPVQVLLRGLLQPVVAQRMKLQDAVQQPCLAEQQTATS